MADKIPVRYLPDEEAQPSLGEYHPGDTVPVAFGGTGATTPEDARTNLGIVGAPGSVTEYTYMMALPPTVTPTAGYVSRDDADPTVVTTLYFNEMDAAGDSSSGFLSAVKAGDWVNLYLASDANVHEQYDATGPAVLVGDVFAVPVAHYDSAGTLTNAAAVRAFWRIAQDPPVWGTIEGMLADQTDLHTLLPTTDQKAALDNNATLDSGNTVASMADITLVGDGRYTQSTDDSVADIVTLTQAEYDALTPPDSTTLYLICEATP